MENKHLQTEERAEGTGEEVKYVEIERYVDREEKGVQAQLEQVSVGLKCKKNKTVAKFTGVTQTEGVVQQGAPVEIQQLRKKIDILYKTKEFLEKQTKL